MSLANSPLVNLLTDKPINFSQTLGQELANPGGTAGSGTINGVPYNIPGTPVTGNLYEQVAVGAIGLILIIMGLVMLTKTDLKNALAPLIEGEAK